MYKAEIIKHSITEFNHELVTFIVTYPRIIHAEMCRHRAFSRNTSSSRAIPFSKTESDLKDNCFVPIAWQKKHSGMQGDYYFKGIEAETFEREWLNIKNNVITDAMRLHAKELTKQLTNRLVEPFTWTTEIITTSLPGLLNFFELRCPKYKYYLVDRDGNPIEQISRSKGEYFRRTNTSDEGQFETLDWLSIDESPAEIHIQQIAELMYEEFCLSQPERLLSGVWHAPFIDSIDVKELSAIAGTDNLHDTLLKISTARCARLSYKTLGEEPKIDYEADLRLFDKLLKEKHMSPFEHCARTMSKEEVDYYTRNGSEKGWCNNFQGFVQYRFIIENEGKIQD